jgi:two-component system chemotaxis response regulator CheB
LCCIGTPSALAHILARAGPVPAVAAQDGDPLAHGRIYVAPADRHLQVTDSQIKLSQDPPENGHRPAINPLLRSAARYYGPRTIGVILSGSLALHPPEACGDHDCS